MTNKEASPLLSSPSASTRSSSLFPWVAIGGFILGLLFVSFGLSSTDFLPRQSKAPILEAAARPSPAEAVHRATEPSERRDLFSQVAIDFSPFNDSTISSGISLEQVERVYCNFDQGGFRLQIVNGSMYVVGERHGIQTRVRNTKLMLMHLHHKHRLPDVDIGWVSVDDGVVALEDGRSDACPEQGPVLVMTKQPQHDHCVMYPDFTFWDWEEAYAVPWQDMEKVMGQAAARQPWQDRRARLFARAFNLGEARSTLKDNEVELAGDDLMDARIIDWHEDPGSFVDLQDHCQYKWLLHTAGNTYSARLKYLLFCKSAVVIPDSPWQEFFYHMLQPGHNVYRVDALTYANRASHLPAVAQYLVENDEEAERIGAAGAAFAEKHLSLDSIDLYWKELIETHAGLMKFRPQVHPDAVPISKSLMNDYARPFDQRTCSVCPRTRK